MANLTREQVAEIIKNAPAGTSPAGIIAGLRQQGHTLEGFAEVQQVQPAPQQSSALRGVGKQLKETGSGLFKGISKFGEILGSPGRALGALAGTPFAKDKKKALQTFATESQKPLKAGSAIIQALGVNLPKQVGTGVGQLAGGTVRGVKEIATGDMEGLREATEEQKAGLGKVGSGVATGLAFVPTPASQFASGVLRNMAEAVDSGRDPREILAESLTAGGLQAVAFKGLERLFSPKIIKEAQAKATKQSQVRAKIKDKQPKRVEEMPTEEIAKTTTRENIAGLRPDIKKRISGKAEPLKEYFDVAKARNVDDLAPSPLSVAADKVGTVRRILTDKLDDTGSGIGKFRQKIQTTKAPVQDIQMAIDKLDDAIGKKGLVVENGKLIGAKGRETIFSTREIQELQNMRDGLLRLKGDPTVIRIIDNRNIIDKNINFAKQAREISNKLDLIAKKVRSSLKDTNRQIIGAEQAQLMDDYSRIADLLEDLNKLTSKGKNAEFLLKRILSERDRIPKKTLDLVFRETGIDLMDDAVMAQVATELLGNPAQKGLFQQEITRAGLDIASILSDGRTAGALRLLTKGAKKFFEPEKAFIRAAEKGPVLTRRPDVAQKIKAQAELKETIKSRIKSKQSPAGFKQGEIPQTNVKVFHGTPTKGIKTFKTGDGSLG